MVYIKKILRKSDPGSSAGRFLWFQRLLYQAGGRIASLGQTAAQEPHSMHVSGSIT